MSQVVQEVSYQSVFALAKQAAQEAFREAKPQPIAVQNSGLFEEFDWNKPYDIVPDGLCGFAWVNIFADRRKPQGKALKQAGVKWDDYRKAFSVSSYDLGCHGQSYERKSAGCQAAAEVFRRYGYSAYAESRLD